MTDLVADAAAAGPEVWLGDWTPSELERNGRELLAGIRRHLEGIRDRPVTTAMDAAQVQALLSGPLPEEPEDFAAILDDTWEKVVPNLSLWHHPSFHAYFSNSTSGPAILAETLTAVLNVNVQQWRTAPAAAALERTVLRWVADLAGYPADADGVLVNGASLATFYALAAARDSLADLDVREHGLAGRDLPRLRIYTSDQAHNSVDKAAIALGIGSANVVRLPADGDHRLPPERLAAVIRDDLRGGRRPFAVVGVVGTTSTGAVDPLPEIAQICAEHDLWLHVDAAYGGLWRVAEEVRPCLPDPGVADSIVVNPHKVLFNPMEISALYCRRKDALPNTFRLVPEFLRTPPDDAAIDYMNYGLQLGRQFRALKLWWVIRTFGRSGLAARLSQSVRMADDLRAEVAAHPDWRLVASSPFPLVCLRYEPAEPDVLGEPPHERRRRVDALNERICEAVYASGQAYVSHTVLPETGYVIRVSIGNIQTTPRDVRRLWLLLQRTAEECRAGGPG